MSKTTDLLSSFGPIVVPPTPQPIEPPIPHDPGKRVPNKHPTIANQPYRIAIVGEAPGRDEHYQGLPFVGISGRLLTQFLSKAHIIREACFIGNICQFQPQDNDISRFAFDGPDITNGLSLLTEDLNKFDPNIILLLGKTALRCALGKDNIGDWRGSFFISNIPGPFYGRKCIASYHPAACLRQWEWAPLLMMDIKKCKEEATTKELVLPIRDLISHPTYNELINSLDSILVNKPKLSPDIEGGVSKFPCCSLSDDASRSTIIPFENLDGTSFWPDEEQELQVLKRFVVIMADAQIHKIFQNGLYDRFVLQYGYNIFVGGNTDDTMLKFWEQYCELEKSLGFQGSILTKEQYYKFERKASDRETFYRYCCKDSALTFEINEKLDKILQSAQKEHYYFNVSLLNALLYMELRGIKYDSKLAKARLLEINHQIYELQHDLDSIAGNNFPWDFDRQQSQAKVSEILCYKKDPHRPKAGNEDSYQWCSRVLLGQGKLTKSELGRLNTELKLSLNIKSKNFKSFLYETLKLPTQYKKGKKGEAPKVTTDFEALLKLMKKTDNPCIKLAINIGMHRTRAQMLRILPGPGGRMHCSYNIVGTETGRISSSRSMIYAKDGTKKPRRVGTNMQTVSDDWDIEDEELELLSSGLRNLYTADLDCYFFQCDLKGSDGWTIGAYMAMLGDRTMLDDLLFGLKPAQVVCYLRRHGAHSLDGKQRPELLEILKEVKKEDWDYYVSKQVIWGTCYLMGPRKVADQILKESYGAVVISEHQAKEFQAAVFARYRVRLWHNWMRHELKRSNNTLTAPNGFKRRFFERDDEILGQALAHMPQVITTWATNMAMFKLWTDYENRISKPRINPRTIETFSGVSSFDGLPSRTALRIEPLHQVHDALCGQFSIKDTPWATNQIKSWFNNPITIAGITLTIPFDGQYGTNWALDDKSKVGTI